MDFDAARTFVAANARVLDRRRFERLVDGGEAGPVRDAVAAYANPDGGFGHALEPDCRAPGSQPAAVALGLRTLHEADAWDDALVAGVLGWLEAAEPEGGGAGFIAPGVDGWPHAPWWQFQAGNPPSIISTGPIVGIMLVRGIRHPWLDRAEAWVRERLAGPFDGWGEYELRGAAGFLEFVPDPAVAARLDAPPPHAAVDGQQPDGGWTFDWPQWNAAATLDWRGSLTVDAVAQFRGA